MASSLSLWERLGRGELLCHLLPYAVVCRRTLPRAGVVPAARDLAALRRCPGHYQPMPGGYSPKQAVIEVLKACAACRVARRLGSNAEGLDDLSVWEVLEGLW
jgi:hypothetical protein